jgi:hypothetical protein
MSVEMMCHAIFSPSSASPFYGEDFAEKARDSGAGSGGMIYG